MQVKRRIVLFFDTFILMVNFICTFGNIANKREVNDPSKNLTKATHTKSINLLTIVVLLINFYVSQLAQLAVNVAPSRGRW